MSDIEKVKQLRHSTGAGFNDCNAAIKEASGNLEKAANLLPEKDKKDFIAYVSSKTWLIGHCIFISKNKNIMDRFYNDLFSWLSNCEKIFGFKSNNYDTKRIYSFLTERYMPFWFEKYAKVLTWPWVFFDISRY